MRRRTLYLKNQTIIFCALSQGLLYPSENNDLQQNSVTGVYYHNEELTQENGNQFACDCLETVGFIVKTRETGCIWEEKAEFGKI